MIDTLWKIVTAPLLTWESESSKSDEELNLNFIPIVLRELANDLTSEKVIRESHQFVKLCGTYTEDWKTGDHYLTAQGDKDWANDRAVIWGIFYHFCGGKTLYEQLPPLDLEDIKSEEVLRDERPALRLRVGGEDVGVKLDRDVLYLSPEGHLMTKFSVSDPEILIRRNVPSRFNVDINRYVELHQRLFADRVSHS